jgi:hypothetical protein
VARGQATSVSGTPGVVHSEPRHGLPPLWRYPLSSNEPAGEAGVRGEAVFEKSVFLCRMYPPPIDETGRELRQVKKVCTILAPPFRESMLLPYRAWWTS